MSSKELFSSKISISSLKEMTNKAIKIVRVGFSWLVVRSSFIQFLHSIVG